MSLATGSRIGPYEILSLLGAGGMGEVYRARDTKLNRDVALKVLPARFALDPERLARFKREAQILASLSHPNIAPIYGLEESDGAQALVLELVEGPTLADRIAEGPIPLDDTLPIARQIAEALEAAHEQGIVHRDLKPANIKIREDGTVKILDFGLARLADPTATTPPGAPGTTATPTIASPAMLTGVGMILGTAAYMAPEQAKGRPADKRSDIWAFGCVIYEMLIGTRAFAGEDVSDTLAAVLRGEPDWSALPTDVPDHIRLLLRRCLEKDRSKRVSDMSVARFLITEPFGTTSGELSVSQRPMSKRALPAVAAAIVAAAVAGIGVRLRQPASGPRPVTRFAYNLPTNLRFTNPGRSVLAISPDGTRIAFVANNQLFLKSMSQTEPMPIRGTEAVASSGGVTSPVFSPDGESLVFWSGGDLKRIPITGGAPVTLRAGIGNPFGMSWDGDSLLVGAGGGGILRVPANGGVPEVVIAARGNEILHGPQMMPGGRALLFTVGAPGQSWDSARIVVQRMSSTERKTIINAGSDGHYLATGHIVYSVGGVLFAMPFDVEKLEATGAATPVVEGVARPALDRTGAAHFAVSDTGSLVYVSGPSNGTKMGWELVTFDRTGAVQSLKLPVQNYVAPRFAPNGQRVAVGIEDGNDANIWIYDLSGTSRMRQLTFGGKNRFPVWTPDGTGIAFQSDREGDPGIFWQLADGSRVAERLTTAAKGEAHVPVGWFPKGDRLMFSAKTDQGYSLSVLALQTGQVEPLGTDRFVTFPHPSLSSDGRWLAYQQMQPDGLSTVIVQPLPPTSKYRVGEGFNPFWAPDGRTLYFAEHVGGPEFSAVTVTTTRGFEVSKQAVVMPRPVPGGGGPNLPAQYDLSPDGEHFVIATFASAPSPFDRQIDFVLNWTEELKRLVLER